MKNNMTINGYRAVIQYDPEIDKFRGEFIDLNGSADFYASDIRGLKREGKLSLKVFLEMCAEDNVEPLRQYSGKFNVRIPKALHADIAHLAAAEGKSLNQWVVEKLNREAHDGKSI